MVTETGETRAMEGGATVDLQAVSHFHDLGAHRAQIVGDGGDSVGFLDTQFLGVPDDSSAVSEGASDSELFAAQEQDETTALLTAFASGDLSRRIHDGSVHSIDIEGSLIVYQRPVPGASWDDPTSFQFGDQVATFQVRLQDVLTVFAPGQGLPTLNGDMEQTLADELGGRGRGPRFGHVGARARLLATGLGTLVDPVALNSRLEMAGNWSSK